MPCSDSPELFAPETFAAEFAYDALRAFGGSGSQNMWLGRAFSLLFCIRECAAADPAKPVSQTFRDCLALDALHRRYISHPDAHARDCLGAYLKSLPGYDSAAFEAKLSGFPGKSSQTAYEQHGYLSMQLSPIFQTFAEVFDNPALACRRDALPPVAQSFLDELSIFTQEDYFRSFPSLAKALAMSERAELRQALPELGRSGDGEGCQGSKSL